MNGRGLWVSGLRSPINDPNGLCDILLSDWTSPIKPPASQPSRSGARVLRYHPPARCPRKAPPRSIRQLRRSQLITAATGIRHGPFRRFGVNSRFFPSSREFLRFSPRNPRLPAKTVKQIKPLPANSRSNLNREFAPAQPGNKLAEPGIIAKNYPAPASCHDGRAPKEKQKQTHPYGPSKCDKHKFS